MAMDRRVREAIKEEIQERKAVTVDDIANIIKIYADRPDPVELMEQWYKRQARNFIAGIKDEYGQRDLFAIKTADGERVYINVPNEDNPLNLKLVNDQLNKKYEDLNRSKKKVQNRQREIANQMQFDFAVNR